MNELHTNILINNINNQLLDTLDIGTNSVNNLTSQREVLINTDNNINKIDKNLKISDKIVTRMNSFSKRLSYLFKKPKHNITTSKKNSFENNTEVGKPKVASLPPVGEFTNNVWLREASADLGLPLNIQNTTIEKTTELEADDIDILLTNVKKLKQISKIMNTELKLQNNILDSIDEKTDNSNIKIKKINKNINKLL